MSTFMSQEVLDSLTKAGGSEAKSTSRMRVQAGDDVFPILRLSEDRFSLDCKNVPALQGFVDILDGARLKCRALIVASCKEASETVFEFEKAANIAQGPALDFEQFDDATVS